MHDLIFFRAAEVHGIRLSMLRRFLNIKGLFLPQGCSIKSIVYLHNFFFYFTGNITITQTFELCDSCCAIFLKTRFLGWWHSTVEEIIIEFPNKCGHLFGRSKRINLPTFSWWIDTRELPNVRMCLLANITMYVIENILSFKNFHQGHTFWSLYVFKFSKKFITLPQII